MEQREKELRMKSEELSPGTEAGRPKPDLKLFWDGEYFVVEENLTNANFRIADYLGINVVHVNCIEVDKWPVTFWEVEVGGTVFEEIKVFSHEDTAKKFRYSQVVEYEAHVHPMKFPQNTLNTVLEIGDDLRRSEDMAAKVFLRIVVFAVAMAILAILAYLGWSWILGAGIS